MRLSAQRMMSARARSPGAHKCCPGGGIAVHILAISVNTRNRCGLDPMLVGNILSALNVEHTTWRGGTFYCRTHPR